MRSLPPQAEPTRRINDTTRRAGSASRSPGLCNTYARKAFLSLARRVVPTRKGFAIVAAEVKNLAGQTAKATEEIAAQVDNIQDATADAVEAIQTISVTMQEVDRYTGAIATAVEEQGTATGNISRSVSAAAAGSQQVATNVSAVLKTARETEMAAQKLDQDSREVADEADQLRSTIDAFLGAVIAA